MRLRNKEVSISTNLRGISYFINTQTECSRYEPHTINQYSKTHAAHPRPLNRTLTHFTSFLLFPHPPHLTLPSIAIFYPHYPPYPHYPHYHPSPPPCDAQTPNQNKPIIAIPMLQPIHPTEKPLQHQDPSPQKHSKHSEHIEHDISRYLDMQKLNPDWQFAAKHGRSTRPGHLPQTDRHECICCLREINKTPIDLFDNSKDLEFLGYGFPLYFIFMKYVILLLLLLVVGYTSLGLFWAIQENSDFCVNHVDLVESDGKTIPCSSYMVLFARIEDRVKTDEHLLRLSSFVTMLLVLLYMRDSFRKIGEYYDERNTSYSDFSVLLENLPTKPEIAADPLLQGKTIGNIVKDFLSDQQIFCSPEEPHLPPAEPLKMVFIGEFHKLEQLEREKRQTVARTAELRRLNQQLKHREHEAGASRKELEEADRERKVALRHEREEVLQSKKTLEEEIEEEKEKISALMRAEDVDCDKVILSFLEEHQREDLEERFLEATPQQLTAHFGSKASKLKLTRAPEPYEINWENINMQRSHQIQRIVISWAIFVLMLGCLSAAFFFLLKYKSHEIELAIELGREHSDPQEKASLETKARVIVFCSLILIILFNKFVLAYVIHHLVEFEKHSTGQSAQFALTVKYTLGLFFTTALMTLLVEGAAYHNVFHSDYGIVEEETIMFYFSSFLVPFIWLINPWHLYQLIKRKLNEGSPYLTQEQANKLMEDPEYLMGKRYGEVMETVWFTYLYACVIPFGSILVLFGLCIFYWVDKYNLLRKSSILQGVAGNLNMKALKMLEFILILKPAGELIFDKLLRDEWTVVSVVELSIGGVYVFLLPLDSLLDYFHVEHFQGTTINYHQLEKNNIMNYEIFNPFTKEQELKKHFERIEGCSNTEHPHHKNHPHAQPADSHQHPHHDHPHRPHRKTSKTNPHRKLTHHRKERSHSIIRPHFKPLNDEHSEKELPKE